MGFALADAYRICTSMGLLSICYQNDLLLKQLPCGMSHLCSGAGLSTVSGVCQWAQNGLALLALKAAAVVSSTHQNAWLTLRLPRAQRRRCGGPGVRRAAALLRQVLRPRHAEGRQAAAAHAAPVPDGHRVQGPHPPVRAPRTHFGNALKAVWTDRCCHGNQRVHVPWNVVLTWCKLISI